jgi:NitT/TauT family transport system permease protein
MSPDSSATKVLNDPVQGSELPEIPPDEPGRLAAPQRVREGGLGRRLWASVWPKLLAIGLALFAWQVVVWSGWRPPYLLPGPVAVFRELGSEAGTPEFWQGIAWTLRRGLVGFAVAVVVGTLLGIATGRIPVLRTAIGSLITGLQTMPSIAWFPLAILLFQLSETAILAVILLGAVPSIANGILAGIDHVPPSFVRLGHVLGARGLTLYRHVVIPAALPAYVGGLGQGWAFAWRSLMAGELLVIIEGRPSLGQFLQFGLDFSNSKRILAVMIVILILGMLVDAVFSAISRGLRVRRGLLVEKGPRTSGAGAQRPVG